MSWFLPQASIHIDHASMRDVEALAAIHDESFERGWGADEIGALLSQPTVLCLTARRTGVMGARRIVGFLLIRFAADEAEILSVAVSQASRGRGTGRRLVEEALRIAYREHVGALFLEVDEENARALSLYRSLGFVEVGRRPAYYGQGDDASCALVMQRQVR
jgi:ribosomal-protein-alanine N-acetyltransferase